MNRSESDVAWKEILETYFKDCLDYCLPHLSELIHWKRSWTSLDKELQSITKNGETGKRLLDKLFKVYLKDGKEQWILIHIEVQSKPDKNFAQRMFTYGYRIYDKYQKTIASCAILTDDNKEWRPHRYEVGIAGSYLSSEFLVVKLIDYKEKASNLKDSNNPFASVILVQLAALEMKSESDEHRWRMKFSLTRLLYDKGFNKQEVSNLYRFIDWLIGLPEELELEYLKKVYELEESKKMPYITSAERLGMKRGMEKGIEKGIEKVAKHLLKDGAKPVYIKKVTGLSLARIKELQQPKKKSN